MSPTSWMSRRSWISIEEPVKKRLERAAEHDKHKAAAQDRCSGLVFVGEKPCLPAGSGDK